MARIETGCYGIVVDHDKDRTGGSVVSDLHEKGEGEVLKAAIDTLEAFVLAAALAGIDITTSAFLEAIEVTVDGINNNLT